MPTIRLDKYISDAKVMSRKDSALAIRNGRVRIGDSIVKKPDTKIDTLRDVCYFDDKEINFCENLYIMLNKPSGLVCAASDARDATVLSLFDKSYADRGLFSCGRLDKDTVGLLILTTDGELSHRLLSPKHHAKKVYYVEADKPFEQKDTELFKNGIVMDGKKTKPALLEICAENPTCAKVTLTEGKFHEIKRLCYACGQKKVKFLKRIEFAGLCLDESLSEGQWRVLSDEELQILRSST